MALPRHPWGRAPRRGAEASASQAHASTCGRSKCSRQAARDGRTDRVPPAAAHPAQASASSFQ
eukprot:4042325-Lingulodinium_polyedra.AAC.1